MDLRILFENITRTLHIGNLLQDPEQVQGGLMHKMYRIQTAQGTYAVKLLNPTIMKRPEARNNYDEADRLETIIQEAHVPIVSALIFDNKKRQEVDGQYFYVYNWYNGKTLKDKQITIHHCQKIGKVLSQIHKIDRKNKSHQYSLIKIDWNYYLLLAKAQNSAVFDLLSANKELLCAIQNYGNTAIQTIPAIVSICHNDMDCKNVLWSNNDFRIIDLECLSYANPFLELFELALCWSGYDTCNIDFKLFRAFIVAYFDGYSIPKLDWESLYYSNYRRLEWLEYNVKRALLIDCDTIQEQEIGIEQVKITIAQVIYYHHAKAKIISCLNKL